MKTKVRNPLKQAGITVIAITLLLTSCKKENTENAAITEEDAVEVMTQAVSDESGGLSVQTEDAAKIANTTDLVCGQLSDTSFSGQNSAGAVITYNYSVQMSRQLTCNGNVPQQFTFNYTGQNSYNAPRMSSGDNTTAGFVITGLEPSATQYVFNQQYVRNGTQQSKIRYQRSFTSTLTITSSNIVVNKATQKIVSGSATVQFAGSTSGGGSVSYGGTITFLGNSQATLALNNGNNYSLQW